MKGEADLWIWCLALQMGGSAWSAPFLERWKKDKQRIGGTSVLLVCQS